MANAQDVERLESVLVDALYKKFGTSSEVSPAAARGPPTQTPVADDAEVFAFLQSDWEREEVMKLKDLFGKADEAHSGGKTAYIATSVAKDEEETDTKIEDSERLQALLAKEYVAGLQEAYMCCPPSTSSGVGGKDADCGGLEVNESMYEIAGATAVEPPPRFASRLLNDEIFRARVSGRNALRNDFVAAGTILTRAAELLAGGNEDVLPLVNENTVRSLIEKWRSTSYLMSTPRLHKADVARMCECVAIDKKLREQEKISEEGVAARAMGADANEEGKAATLEKIKRKVAASERRDERNRKKASREAASVLAQDRLFEIVLHSVRVDVERFEAAYKSSKLLKAPPISPEIPASEEGAEECPRRVLLSDVPVPSLATLFQAKDPDGSGWMSFSHAMLAFRESSLLITSTEMFILVSRLIRKDSEWNGQVPWPHLLEMIGASKPVGGEWSPKCLLDDFQAWETSVQERLLAIQGFCGPEDVAKLILCQPSVTAQFTKTHMRRYSVALAQHPVLQSPLFMRISSGMREKHEALSTVLRAFDTDLRLAVTRGDVKYAFQCAGVRLQENALSGVCQVFKFPEGKTGRDDDVYGSTGAASAKSAKFGVPFPDIDCERLLLSVSPGLAILHQDKEMDGIRSSHFMRADATGKLEAVGEFDVYAVMASVSAAVYDKMLALRERILELPSPSRVTFEDLSAACGRVDIEMCGEDRELLLEFCRADTRDEFIDGIRFMWILAAAATPASISYQMPPMQIVESTN